MRDTEQKFQIGGLVVFVCFGVFACCLLLVLLTGADSYRRLAERDGASFDRRTAVQYVAARVRSADAANAVSVGSFDGGAGNDTLFLREDIDGASYVTRVYCYDGSIRELFTEADAPVSPEDGEQVLSASGLTFAESDGVLTVSAAEDGGAVTELTLLLRSGSEGRSAS